VRIKSREEEGLAAGYVLLKRTHGQRLWVNVRGGGGGGGAGCVLVGGFCQRTWMDDATSQIRPLPRPSPCFIHQGLLLNPRDRSGHPNVKGAHLEGQT